MQPISSQPQSGHLLTIIQHFISGLGPLHNCIVRTLFSVSRGNIILCTLTAILIQSKALALGTIKNIQVTNSVVTVEFLENPGVYYLLEYSEDLATWHPADMSLGIRSELDLQDASLKGFFRAAPLSKFSPTDTDGDGIDDMYELSHKELNPLDPNDGSKLAPNGGGLSNYQVYLSLFGITSYKLLQREAREVSVFNFGLGINGESISREQTVFNLGTPRFSIQADSLEVSLFNGQAIPASTLLQLETREISVYNIGGVSQTLEAFSREISVFSGSSKPLTDVVKYDGREWSVFNFGSPSAAVESISREISTLNFNEP